MEFTHFKDYLSTIEPYRTLRTRNNYSFPTFDGTKYIKDITIFNNMRVQRKEKASSLMSLNWTIERARSQRKWMRGPLIISSLSLEGSSCFSKDYQILREYVSITSIYKQQRFPGDTYWLHKERNFSLSEFALNDQKRVEEDERKHLWIVIRSLSNQWLCVS